MTDGCGPPCSESFATYDPDSSSWRMCEGSLFGASIGSSEIWPISGTTRNGAAFRQEPLVPLTGDLASSSWPTPLAADGRHGPDYARMNRPKSGGDDLTTAVARYESGRVRAAERTGATGTPPTEQTADAPTPSTSTSATDGGKQTRPSLLNPEWVEWLMGFPIGWTG